MTEHLTERPTQLRLEDALSAPTDILAPDPLIIRLNKVFSWQQSASRWPFYLSRAEPGRAYTKAEIIEQVFGDDLSHHSAPERGWLQALYSLHIDRENAEVVFDGVGLFDGVDGGRERFRISEDGLALARSYSTDRLSQNWKGVFAGILARNDVRVRAVLLHLGCWGAYLTFHNVAPDGFFARGAEAILRLPDGDEQPLFAYTKGASPAYSFTAILQRNTTATLGPFLRAKIEEAGVRVPDHVEIQGGREAVRRTNKEPSANDLHLYMRQSLALFRDIGALVYLEHKRGWTLDQERCAALFAPELVADLFAGKATDSFLIALRTAYKKLSDSDGFVRVTDIREYVGDELDIAPGERAAYFNRQVAHYMRPDISKLGLGRLYHAQAAPDECLFGNLEMEYVEFTFAE